MQSPGWPEGTSRTDTRPVLGRPFIPRLSGLAMPLALVVLLLLAPDSSSASALPPSWEAGIAEGSLLVNTNTSWPSWQDQGAVLTFSATLGNGIVATLADYETVYLGGIYNTFVELDGRAGFFGEPEHVPEPGWRVNSSARAAIPATSSSVSLSAEADVTALDVRRGVYLARWEALGTGGCLSVERRTYAPRVDAPLLVTEFVLSSNCSESIVLPLRTTFNASSLQRAVDFHFETYEPDATTETKAFGGTTATAEPICLGTDEMHSDTDAHPTQECTLGDPGQRPSIAVVYDPVPPSLTAAANSRAVVSFVSAYGSSLNTTVRALLHPVLILERAPSRS